MSQLYLNGQPISSGYTITIYRYEPFDYAFTWSPTDVVTRTASTLIQSLISGPEEVSGEVYTWFTSPGYPQYPGPRIPIPQTEYGGYTGALSDTEQIVFTFSSPVARTYTINVMIKAGRFVEPLLTTPAFTLYKNESIATTFGSNILFQAPGNLTVTAPFTVPTLPPGIGFVPRGGSPSLYWDLTGTPPAQTPSNSYIVYAQGSGTNSSRIISKTITLSVEAERIVAAVQPSSNLSLTVGTAIPNTTLTARYPNQFSGNLVYAWSFLPDGLQFLDVNSNTVISPFAPLDASATMILSGTPTVSAAQYFRTLGVSNIVTNVLGTRQTSPNITVTQPFSLTFGETVLFDTTVVPTLYRGVALDPSAIVFRASTYFPFSAGVASIAASSLPAGLSLVHAPGDSNAYLTGTPTTSGSATYILTATNSNAVTRTLNVPITVTPDTISFSGTPADVCYNFVISRPLATPLTGYYPSTISYSATAASGANVVLSITNPPPGVTVTTAGSNLALSGVPDAITPLTSAIITATAPSTGATQPRTLNFATLDDVFTFADISASSLSFIQNVPATSFRVTVSTLSGRNVINYSQSGFPAGISISPTGLVSGTPTASAPTAGNVTITATTGYTSGSRDFSYNLIPDSVLFVVKPPNYGYLAGQTIETINIDAVAYSGTSVSNYDLSMGITYGLTFNSSNGTLTGTWTTGIPPDTLLPSLCNFAITAQAGQLTGVLPAQFTADPIVQPAMLFAAYGNPTGESEENSWLYYTTPANPSVFSRIEGGFSSRGVGDIQIKNNNPESNVIIASAGTGVFRMTRTGGDLSFINFPTIGPNENRISGIANISGTSNWRAGGRRGSFDNGCAVLFPSSNDGITWDTSGATTVTAVGGFQIKTRDDGVDTITNPYLRGGLAVRYHSGSGTLVVGGLQSEGFGITMTRSLDGGATALSLNGGFAAECAYLSLDTSSMWIATGSDLYESIDYSPEQSPPVDPFGLGPTNTIKYSIDQGSNWSNASGGFNMFGYEVVYANNTWLATGVDVSSSEPDFGGTLFYVPQLRYSTNGTSWSIADLSTNYIFSPSNETPLVAPLRIGSMNFDGNFWNVLVNAESQDDDTIAIPTLYRHDASSSLANGWFAVDVSSSLVSGEPDVNTSLRFLALAPPRDLFSGTPPINIALRFETNDLLGPTFTSPITLSYIQYQYMPIVPIQISATATLGQLYLFVEAGDLPPGLVFNQFTGKITGTPVRLGNDSVTVYAKDDNGISSIVLTFTTLVPQIIRKQSGAGAYTSLLRQYVTVNGAQASRDSVALPVQERNLGEFMSPDAPSVVTQTVDPKCFSTSNCT